MSPPTSRSPRRISRSKSTVTPPRGSVLSASLIDETLYDAFGQRQIATMYGSTNQYKVILEVKPEFQDDPTALSKIYVIGPDRDAGAAQHVRPL